MGESNPRCALRRKSGASEKSRCPARKRQVSMGGTYYTKEKPMRLIEPNGMKEDAIDSKLDELLVLWHQWRSSYSVGKGFSGHDSTCRDYRAPTHWDWKNGALEGRIEAIEVKAVGDAIDKIPNSPHRWQTALSFEARNLSSGAHVWTSPVLPKNKAERDVLVLEARNMLLVELRRAGVFD